MRRSLVVSLLVSTVLVTGVAVVARAQVPEFKLDHFKVYKVAPSPGVERKVALQGQFDKEPIAAAVRGPVMFANPVAKNRGTIIDKNAHLNWYNVRQEKVEPKRVVVVRNQFAGGRPQKLILGQPKFLLVPTKKAHDDNVFPIAKGLDHFKAYEVLEAEPSVNRVALKDQFESEQTQTSRPIYFCVPVNKTHGDRITKINNERDHLTVYVIRPKDQKIQIEVSDQLGQNKLRITASQYLCLPTLKEKYEEIPEPKPEPDPARGPEFKLDHFKVYKVAPISGIETKVALQGQFDREPVPAVVRVPVMFANPVAKNRGVIFDKNAHLNWYNLRQERVEPKRTVIVHNQFNRGRPQKLILGQPKFLLVPTKKVHDDKVFPIAKGLDHFKVYEVLEAEPVSAKVVLADQFEREENVATKPVYFCVPVIKRHGDRITKIANQRDHLTVYVIRPKEQKIGIQVSDQIGQNRLRVTASQYLCLPSLKEILKKED